MTSVLLHVGYGPVNLSAWTFEPSVIALAFIIVSFYFYGVTHIPGAFSPWRAASFVAGAGIMFLALTSPLDTAANRLLSMHMLQHVLLATVGPPLVLLGLTPELLRPLFKAQPVRRVAQYATHPVFTATLFIVNMWFWHVPPVYGEALTTLPVHITMHVLFMGTGLLFWWPVIQPLPDLGKLGDGGRLLYLFATGMPMGLLAMLFFASNTVIYSYYQQVNPLWGIGPQDDQQIAGLIMGALGEAASFAAITLLFFRFLDSEEASATQAGPVDAA